MMSTGIEEAVRTSHCSARLASGELPHKCMGTCTITPDGMKLSCPLCGDDGVQNKVPHAASGYAQTGAAVFKAAGFDWDALTADAQLSVIQTLSVRACPGCGRLEHFDRFGDHECACGEYRWSTNFAVFSGGKTWQRRTKATA